MEQDYSELEAQIVTMSLDDVGELSGIESNRGNGEQSDEIEW